MQQVLVIDKHKQPLMPCHPGRARKLLKEGKAAVFRHYPFTIILKEVEGGEIQPLTLKIDHTATTTGIALVSDNRVVWAAEIQHRSVTIRKRLMDRSRQRRNRRVRKTRYRPKRFLNRRSRQELPPSMESRVTHVMTWVNRLRRYAPINRLSVEETRFDPRLNLSVYRQGTPEGYEMREYLLEKWGRKCAYCGKHQIPLQLNHLIPLSRGGDQDEANLTLACEDCAKRKGNLTAADFGHARLYGKARRMLLDSAAYPITRAVLIRRLSQLNLPLETSSGGRTKYNRVSQGYPRAAWIDAACVGQEGEQVRLDPAMTILCITATGHGRRQRCKLNKFGFPVSHSARNTPKTYLGIQTGDIVSGYVLAGKYRGWHFGRVKVRFKRRWFTVNGVDIQRKYLRVVHRADGYEYSFG